MRSNGGGLLLLVVGLFLAIAVSHNTKQQLPKEEMVVEIKAKDVAKIKPLVTSTDASQKASLSEINSTQNEFATAINCMDGRTQDVVRTWIKRAFQVNWVDTITEAGPVKILAENEDKTLVEGIKARLSVSVEKHHSKIVAIVAHDECAGNPVEEARQIEQLRLAKKTVESFGFSVEVILLWVAGDWETVKRIE